MREISWIRAYAGSAVVHLLVVGAAAMFLAGAVMQQEQQQMYVIDLDTSELSSAGSGHAGGGSGGELFPEKLSETAVAERVAQIDASQSAVRPHPQLSDAVPEPAPSSQPAPAAASSSAAGGGGVGSSVGAGSGTGTGSGVGDGTGDGQGYGEGAGDGQGSGYSGAEGTGSSPFDSDGFWSAVNANKSYPPMAVRRGLTGSVTITVTLDSSGNCVNAYVSGSSGQSILDKAALNAVYAACPYPNASGQDVTVNVPVTFNLN